MNDLPRRGCCAAPRALTVRPSLQLRERRSTSAVRAGAALRRGAVLGGVALATELHAAERRRARDLAQLGFAHRAVRAQLLGLLPERGLAAHDVALGDLRGARGHRVAL